MRAMQCNAMQCKPNTNPLNRNYARFVAHYRFRYGKLKTKTKKEEEEEEDDEKQKKQQQQQTSTLVVIISKQKVFLCVFCVFI